MPDTKISADPPASALSGTEVFAGVQSSANVKVTAAQIATYVNAQPLDATLTALAGATWSAGTQVLALTAADTVTLKTVGSASGNILDKAAADSLYQPTGSYLTGNQTVTLSGDASGSGATSISVTVSKINGVSLAGLATGILKNTTGTGAPSIAVAADFPTLNQNTTGSAATLTTSRNFSITGGGITASAVGFNGSANVALSASVDAGHITLARMASVATGTVFYRKTAGSGDPEVQTLATLKTDLGLTGTNSGDQTITLSGDVSGSGTSGVTATLATVNSNTGSFGSTTAVPVITVNGKGLITAVSTATLGTAAVKNLSIGTTAPASPSTNDLWIDTN